MLVHILHGDPQKPNQPTVQWVLDSFRRVAPEPVGLVLETGRYSGTLYAYLVTRMPDETLLRGWVKQYKAQARDSQEIPAPPVPPTPAPTDVPPKYPPQAPVSVTPVSATPGSPSPVSVTQLLRDFDPPAKSAGPSPPVREAEPPPMPPPPRPLPPLSSAGGQSGLHSAPPWAPETPRIPAAPKVDPNAGRPAESFRPDLAARNFPSPVAPPLTAPSPKEGPKLGEFTSFFQGPFRGDVPSETPAVTPRQEAPQKPVGDFTSMFGAVKPKKEEPPPSPGIAGNEPAGSFTGWFTPEISPRLSSTTAPPGLPRANPNPAPGLSASPLPASGLHAPDSAESGLPSSSFPAAPKDPFTPAKPAYAAPAPPIFPIPVPSNPPLPKPFAGPPAALGSDATGAFSRPVSSEPAPLPQEVPSGPSSYTRVISARPANPDADAAGTEAAAQAGPPAFAMPALAVPKMAPPPLPPPPVPPKPAFAAPAAPKPPAAPKLPAAPKAPKAGAPEPPVSYWPLILILTVLFFVGVLLVLYFVLKH